jgi:hypothetical protein
MTGVTVHPHNAEQVSSLTPCASTIQEYHTSEQSYIGAFIKITVINITSPLSAIS